MNRILFLFAFILSAIYPLKRVIGQSATAFGVIGEYFEGPVPLSFKFSPAGTAFVIQDGRYILTCEHVARELKNPMYTTTDAHFCKLKLIGLDSLNDIALFFCETIISDQPLEFDSWKIGDRVKYFGWNRGRTKDIPIIVTDTSEIYLAGKIQITPGLDRRVVDFFSFPSTIENPVIQGCSGGPVLNESGSVIGMMKVAWYECPENDSTRLTSVGVIPSEIIKKFLVDLDIKD